MMTLKQMKPVVNIDKQSPMTLTPADMLNIQSAIDRYEKKFPRKPSPSAKDALAWEAGKRRVWVRAYASFLAWLQKRPMYW